MKMRLFVLLAVSIVVLSKSEPKNWDLVSWSENGPNNSQIVALFQLGGDYKLVVTEEGVEVDSLVFDFELGYVTQVTSDEGGITLVDTRCDSLGFCDTYHIEISEGGEIGQISFLAGPEDPPQHQIKQYYRTSTFLSIKCDLS